MDGAGELSAWRRSAVLVEKSFRKICWKDYTHDVTAMTFTALESPARSSRLRAFPARAAWALGVLALIIGLILLVRSDATGQRFGEGAQVQVWQLLVTLMIVLPAPAFLSIGALIAARRPGNAIGTLCSILAWPGFVFCLEHVFWIDPGSPFSLWSVMLSRVVVGAWFATHSRAHQRVSDRPPA